MKTVLGHDRPALLWSDVLALALCGCPLLLVTYEHWSNGLLMVGSALCLLGLAWQRATRLPEMTPQPWSGAHWGLISTLAGLMLATMGSAALRGDWSAHQFDTPMRFVIAIPVFLVLLRRRVGLAEPLAACMAIGLLLTGLILTIDPQPDRWGPGRLATAFADPLVLGYTSLTFALIALTVLLFFAPRPWLRVLLVLAAIVGLILSLRTGSRTGWFAAPVLVLIHVVRMGSRRWWGQAHRLSPRTWAAIVALGLVIVGGAVQQRHALTARALEAVRSLEQYPGHGLAPDTPTALRLTFLRMGFDLIEQRPLQGHGDTYLNPPVASAAMQTYASAFAVHTAFTSGFHNEVLTASVQLGIPGGLATLALFVYPLCLFGTRLRSDDSEVRAGAHMGLVLVVCWAVSSLSTEVFGLKYMASFYALCLCLLGAQCLGTTNHLAKHSPLAPPSRPS